MPPLFPQWGEISGIEQILDESQFGRRRNAHAHRGHVWCQACPFCSNCSNCCLCYFWKEILQCNRERIVVAKIVQETACVVTALVVNEPMINAGNSNICF